MSLGVNTGNMQKRSGDMYRGEALDYSNTSIQQLIVSRKYEILRKQVSK